QFGVGRQRRLVAEFKHPRHQRSLTALGIEYRIEVFLLPGALAEGVVKQARGRCRLGAFAVIYRHLARATGGAFATAEIELTGRVIARMAGYALLGEDRLDISAV